MARSASRRGIAAGFAVAVLAFSLVAGAKGGKLIQRRMWFAESGAKLVVTTSFTELLDKKAYERLKSGFATTIVARIYVYKKGRERPVSMVMASFRAVYDLWDEVYVVRIDGAQGRKKGRYESRAEALKALTSLEDCPISPLARIPRGPHHYMAMVVELNPVSKELLAEMRRWLTKSAGSASLDRSSSFFGSFVSVFVNPKLPEADRVLRFRSQPFYRTKE